MNMMKKIALVGVVAAASSFADTVWWESGDGQTSTKGYMYVAAETGSDAGNAATSMTCGTETWPAKYQLNETGTDWANCINDDGDVEVSFTVVPGEVVPATGSSYWWGFGMVGFNFTDPKSKLFDLAAAGYTGISMQYEADAPQDFFLVLRTDGDKNGSGMQCEVDPSATSTTCMFDKMEMAPYSDATLDLKTAASIEVKFHYTDDSSNKPSITISNITLLGGTGTGDAVLSSSVEDGVQLALAGKSLSFKTTSDLNVEVFDLQGRLVANGMVSESNSALNLNNLSQGSYVIRATGDEVNMMKISLHR